MSRFPFSQQYEIDIPTDFDPHTRLERARMSLSDFPSLSYTCFAQHIRHLLFMRPSTGVSPWITSFLSPLTDPNPSAILFRQS
jgi:hypothetical protein